MIVNRRQFVAAIVATTAGAPMAKGLEMPKPAQLPRREAVMATARKADRPALLDEALASLDAHGSRVADRRLIGLVDFARPSSEPRFNLVDVEDGSIARSWLVAHGNGSDPRATGMLQAFSNEPGSNATSRGAYLVANTYYGKHGRSQRLLGLDPSNDEALARAIVIHGASYVDPALIPKQGRIGRSQGCFAVEVDCIDRVIAELGEGRFLYAGKSPA